ncbi:MAG: inositol monophosphatase family protein [Solirubrobacteraceae bacterium]
MSLDADLELAFDLAQLAGSIALERFRDQNFSVSQKADGSPVTEVDREVEAVVRDRLACERPGHAINGEEHGRSGSSDCCWYLDPIDGTNRFIRGDPKWMTLIALAVGGRVVLGVATLPVLGERWWASRGGGAFHDGRRVAVSVTNRLTDAVVNDDWRKSLARGETDTPLAAVAANCARVRPHQGHSFLALAAGEVDIALQVGSQPWDYAPVKVIVEEAGGTFTDFEGGERIDTGRVVATNGHIHADVLDVLAPWQAG